MKNNYSNTFFLKTVLVSSMLVGSTSNIWSKTAFFNHSIVVQDIITVSGRVVDGQSKPLLGVNVLSSGKVIGQTDGKGNFKFSIKKGASLTFKSIGFKDKTVIANAEKLNVVLEADDSAIDEVVVTALGIKREERALGYAITTLKGDQLTDAVSNNWMDALSGKVAGLNLMRSNAGPVGGTKIILRGENNLTGENEALIVVDGIVINGGSGKRSANASDAVYGTGSDNMPADYGSGMDDINPEDIESISVLKGPGAAALYGERGANGAIIITTKAGSKKGKGLGITINSNAGFQSINRSPELQYEYGQGIGGAAHYSFGASADGGSTSGTSSAYGPKFDGQSFFQYDPALQAVGKERTPWKAYDNINDFFDVGKTFTNTVTIDGGSDKTTARFSATNVQNSWIVPKSGYKRNTFALAVNSKVTDKLTINSKINYNNRWSDNLPGAGYGNQSLMYWYIFWQPNADYRWLENYWVEGRENLNIKYPFSSYPENPFAIVNEFINGNNRNTFTGTALASYQFNKKFSAQVRAGIDFSTEHRFQNRPYDAGSKLTEGSHRTQEIFSKETTADFLVKYADKVDVWDFSASLGGSTRQNTYSMESLTSDGLTLAGVYNHYNNKYGTKFGRIDQNLEVNSFYGLFTTGYKNFLYLDATGRMDWNSTLASPAFPNKTKGFFYPSLNGSFILSEVVDMPSYVNLFKVRASISKVGSGVQSPYMTSFSYVTPNTLLPGSLSNPSRLANPLVEPVQTRSIESGLDIRLFKGRLDLDLAVYKSNTYNQHLYRIIDASTGARDRLTNIGEVMNKGLEIAVNSKNIVRKGGFNWSSSVTFSKNSNKILQLADSTIVLQQRSVGNGQIVGKVGGSMGDLYGIGYQRSPEGEVIYDPNTGVALLTSDVIYLGNTIPKGKASLGNTFTYKNFKVNLLFDTQWGGVGHSLTHYKLAEQGKTKNTLPGRYSGMIGNGVLANGDGTYRKNDVIATNLDEYYRSHYGQDNAEGSTYPTDFIKFREARIDYTFNSKSLSRYGIQRATVGVYGRDLFIWSKWPAFDPEFGTISGSDIVKGFEIAQFPSTRTLGVNVILGF